MPNKKRGKRSVQGWYRGFGKRALDIVLSALALIILSPVALIVAIAIRLTMGPPVIFLRCGPGFMASPSLCTNSELCLTSAMKRKPASR